MPTLGRRLIFAFLFATSTFGLIACSDLGPAEWQAELDANRARWDVAALTHYYIQEGRICECLPEAVRLATVEVQDGAVVSVIDVETQEPVSPEFRDGYLSVDQLFDVIQDAIDSGAHSIRVEYHVEYGYPFDLFIDYELAVADEEVGYEVTQLTFVEGQ